MSAILWGSVAAVGFIAWQRGRVVLVTSMREGALEFINIVPRIALGVIGSGCIADVIPQEVITGWLGPTSDWLGVLTAVIAGAATPGGPVVGFSIGAVALKAGGGDRDGDREGVGPSVCNRVHEAGRRRSSAKPRIRQSDFLTIRLWSRLMNRHRTVDMPSQTNIYKLRRALSRPSVITLLTTSECRSGPSPRNTRRDTVGAS
jgi:hypothetical protein